MGDPETNDDTNDEPTQTQPSTGGNDRVSTPAVQGDTFREGNPEHETRDAGTLLREEA